MRTVFVSGSTSGIGRAIAMHFARQHYRVCVHGRSADRVEATIDGIRAEVPAAQLIGCPADLTDLESVQECVAPAGEVDILVNNAGAYEPSTLVDSTDEVWQRMWEVNVMSGVRLSRLFVPGMQRRGWGRVVFISSEAAVQPFGDMVAYGASKAAQLGVTRGLAESVKRTGITVNAVLPGPTLTEGVQRLMAQQAEASGRPVGDIEKDYIAEQFPQSLIGRLATVDEVASVVAFLASEAASAVSGAAYRVDGGVMRPVI